MRMRKRLKITVRLSACVLAILSLMCDKSPTGPEPAKDPRTYTWTIDTLAYPGSFQTMMRDIWGSSPNDVYVVGHNDQNRGLMWHFDGKRWTDVRLSTTQGGTVAGPIDLSAIYGFSANDIWAVGEHISSNPTPPPNFLDSSLIIHFDGVQWRESKLPSGRGINDIWGSSPNSIWAAGAAGTLLHYDGTLWTKDSVSNTASPDGFYGLAGRSSDVYMLGVTYQNSVPREIYYFFGRESGAWSLIDTAVVEPGNIQNKWGYSTLWVSPSGTLYSADAGVFRWNGISWIKIFESQASLGGVFGTSDNSFFAVGHFGTLLHYNGLDWAQFKDLQYPSVVYRAGWTDGKEVIIVGTTNEYPQKTLILTGK